MGGPPKWQSISKLTPRESRFILTMANGSTQADAYRLINKNVSAGSARTMGARFMKAIKDKLDWPGLMDEMGLGTTRFLTELEQRLKQTKAIVVDKYVQDVEDGAVRMRATELLADLHGLRKSEVDVKHSGVIDVHYDKEFEGV